MYLLSFSGMLVLSDIFNPQIKSDDWVAERNLMSKDQELRVKNRLKREIFQKIEQMATQDGLSSSDIYK